MRTTLWSHILVVICAVLLFATAAFAQTTPLQITTASLPDGVNTKPYSQSLSAIGGTSPYTWSLSPSSFPLPPGLSLSSAGVISGTPTRNGDFSFTVRVTDSAGSPASVNRTLSMTVVLPLTLLTSTLPNGGLGAAYPAQTLAASGGTTPYLWSVTAGSLPGGLGLSPAGVINGTPTASGTFTFTVTVTDSTDPVQTASKALTIVIQPQPTITTDPQLPLALVGVFYSQQLNATGPSKLIWSLYSGTLPPGISLSSAGFLSGAPSFPGSFDPTIQVAGEEGGTTRQTFHLVVNPALTITTPATLPDGLLSSAYSVTLAATGGLSPYNWTAQGRLPAGLSLSSAGVISGTPTGVGTTSFAVQVEDSFDPKQQVVRTFSITVASSLTITTTTLPAAFKDNGYSLTLQAIGGATPYTWTLFSGTLPAGMTLNSNGVLSGTPTELANQPITVRLTDSRGSVVTKDFTFIVDTLITSMVAPKLPSSTNPAQQLGLEIGFSEPRPADYSGQLVLSFTSKAEVATNDPMTQFSNSLRTVKFKIAANTTTAVLDTPVKLLLGTVAGTVKLTANIDNGPTDVPVATVDILPLPPQFTHIEAIRTAAGLDLLVTGYSPTRRITGADFSFQVKSGSKTITVPVSRSVDSLFATWFQGAASVAYGSAFSYTQSFVLQGSGSTIESVTITLKNAQGNTTSSVIRPQ